MVYHTEEEFRNYVTFMLDKIVETQGDMSQNIAELNRTVRGKNGTPGLVTSVEVVKTKVDALEKSLHTHVTTAESDKRGAAPADPEKTQRDFMNKIIVENGKPIVLAFVIWILLTVLPQVVSQIGNGG